MKKWLLRILIVVFLAFLGVFYYAFSIVGSQGIEKDWWSGYEKASISMDDQGIPTIEAKTWLEVIESQGFVVASERMWQMDLIRRKASGRLSEWFGSVAFEHDKTVVLEDRVAVVKAAYEGMDDVSKGYCDAYARGVNKFIDDFKGRWGVEYKLLSTGPSEWKCIDSLLVVLEMADTLTSSAGREARDSVWRNILSPRWEQYLFTQDHPWNNPYFNGSTRRFPVVPPPDEFLPMVDLSENVEEIKEQWSMTDMVEDPVAVGSNNWAYRGKKGAFLANDPHLGYGVPSIWYLMRLRVSESDWVVGATIPGLPGIVLGMNPHLSWAFTNTGEDVDDYFKEELSGDGKQYIERYDGETPVYADVIERQYEISVKGEDKSREVTGRFTSRGPLSEPKYLNGPHSRQWAPLKEGVLGLPVVNIMLASSIDEMFKAVDSLKTPAQNILIVDRKGQLAYRVSGRGVERNSTGMKPDGLEPGGARSWVKLHDADERKSLVVDESQGEHRYLATANERIWIDDLGHHWAGEDRKGRIVEVLSANDSYELNDMFKLQHDSTSRFRKMLLEWIGNDYIATSPDGPQDPAGRALVENWRKWDGNSRTDPASFYQSTKVEKWLVELLLGRIRKEFGQEVGDDVKFRVSMKRAWLLGLMNAKDSLEIFGFKNGQVAQYLVRRLVVEKVTQPHQENNINTSQHPFVANVPVVGQYFRIDTYPQHGAPDLVLAEQGTFGPSVRLLWNMTDPKSSRWIVPVGQSGHIRSVNFRDAQKDWYGEKNWAVFPDSEKWKF